MCVCVFIFLSICMTVCVGQCGCITWALRCDICVRWEVYWLLQLLQQHRHRHLSSLPVMSCCLVVSNTPWKSCSTGLAPRCCDTHRFLSSIRSIYSGLLCPLTFSQLPWKSCLLEQKLNGSRNLARPVRWLYLCLDATQITKVWNILKHLTGLMVTGDSMIGYEGSILESLSRSRAKMRRGSPLCEHMIV